MSLEESNGKIVLTGEQLAGVALSTIRAVIGDVRYQYLSGPITGGRRFLIWHEKEGRSLGKDSYKDARQLAVVKPNIADIQAAAKLQREAGRDTIEPGSFEADFEHWGQEDFLRFWEKVIEHHAAQVRFMEGWQFSSGCTFEYLCARKHGRETCDMDGGALAPDTAIELLDEALAEIAERFDFSDPRDEPIQRLHTKVLNYRGQVASLS
jgi:hypothetical protein